MGKLWKKSKCFSSLNKLLSFISKSLIYSWKQWSAISTNFWQSKSLGIDSCWTLRKFCFDFRELQQTACPAFLLGVHWQSLLLHGGRLGAGINLKFPQVTDIPTSLEHLQEPTLHNVPSTTCLTVGLHCRIYTQQHQAKPQTLRS